jgi:hypothetical protein
MRSSVVALTFASAVAQAPTQTQIHPTGKAGEFSVDFVGAATALNGKVEFGAHGQVATLPTTSFAYPNIGAMHQAMLDFTRFGVKADERGWYRVTANSATWSANFSVTPFVSNYRAAIFGDFGIANDVVMDQLAQELRLGSYDVVQHVGDFAYDFEEQNSATGNKFQETASQSYAAYVPVSTAPGNRAFSAPRASRVRVVAQRKGFQLTPARFPRRRGVRRLP